MPMKAWWEYSLVVTHQLKRGVANVIFLWGLVTVMCRSWLEFVFTVPNHP